MELTNKLNPLNYLIEYRMVEISNKLIHAVINPIGAELISLSKLRDENILWNKNEVYWNRIAPNLFPIVGRLKNDCYTYHNNTYLLTQHGFARDNYFEVVEKRESSVLFRLVANENSRKIYPFEFIFEILYSIVDNEIEISYCVQNRGEGIMPYSVGGHPGFAIDGNLTDYFLDFGMIFSPKRWMLEGSYFSGETKKLSIEHELKLNYQLFENDAIVFKNPEFKQVILTHNEKGRIAGLSSDTMTAIGFWTKKNAPFLCIEPWWGWADKLESSGNILEKEGIQLLAENETKSHSYKIELF